MAHLGGFEPPAHGLEVRCSILLSYRCIYGAGEGNRTLATSLEGWGSTIELHPQTGGGDWIRTSEGERQRIYSPSPLATWVLLLLVELARGLEPPTY